MRCTMCHEVNGLGANYGPRLEGWAAKQSTSAIIHAIINPSQGIAHGFQGTEYILKDGGVIHGITESRGDPAIVLTQGGTHSNDPPIQSKKLKENETFPYALGGTIGPLPLRMWLTLLPT